jgi:cytochrome c-type biogenesis protein CcmF
MPWLVGTALIHSLAGTEKRGSFKSWTVLLAISSFSLSLLGTFLVRSGVLTSVHAFATDPRRGSAMLALVALTLLISVGLLAARGPRLLPERPASAHGLLSRAGLLGVNGVLLLAACATVLLGTLYPLGLDALALGKISVGAPYFDSVMLPLLLPLLPATALGQALGWGRSDARRLFALLLSPLAVTLVAAAVLPWVLTRAYGELHWLALLGLLLAVLLAAGVLRLLWRNWRQGAPAWGMALAHLGLAVFAVGVTLVNSYGVERDVRLDPGASTALADCTLRFEGIQPERGPNYASLRGAFELSCPNRAPQRLHSEKRSYPGSGMPMTESAIAWGLTRDFYIALGEMGEAGPFGAWMVRVQHKPFMRWVWGGALLMASGALLASCARRYRRAGP